MCIESVLKIGCKEISDILLPDTPNDRWMSWRRTIQLPYIRPE